MTMDSASATRPIAVAVIAYWIAMTFASWQKTYLPMKPCACGGSSSSGPSAGGAVETAS